MQARAPCLQARLRTLHPSPTPPAHALTHLCPQLEPCALSMLHNVLLRHASTRAAPLMQLCALAACTHPSTRLAHASTRLITQHRLRAHCRCCAKRCHGVQARAPRLLPHLPTSSACFHAPLCAAPTSRAVNVALVQRHARTRTVPASATARPRAQQPSPPLHASTRLCAQLRPCALSCRTRRCFPTRARAPRALPRLRVLSLRTGTPVRAAQAAHTVDAARGATSARERAERLLPGQRASHARLPSPSCTARIGTPLRAARNTRVVDAARGAASACERARRGRCRDSTHARPAPLPPPLLRAHWQPCAAAPTARAVDDARGAAAACKHMRSAYCCECAPPR